MNKAIFDEFRAKALARVGKLEEENTKLQKDIDYNNAYCKIVDLYNCTPMKKCDCKEIFSPAEFGSQREEKLELSIRKNSDEIHDIKVNLLPSIESAKNTYGA